MATATVVKDVDFLAKSVSNLLTTYSEAASNIIEQRADVIARELCDNIKNASPKLTGAYRRGWAVRKKNYYPGNFEIIVHNKKEYQLTHLLEKGHRSRNGKNVAPHMHIKPHADRAVEEYTAEVLSILQDGG